MTVPLASVMLVIIGPSIAQLALRLMLLTVDDPFSVARSKTSVMALSSRTNDFLQDLPVWAAVLLMMFALEGS